MKDEFKGKIINGFVGLKSKIHSLISVDDEEVTEAKGVDKKIRHKEFLDALFNEKVIRHNMKRIQSKRIELISSIFYQSHQSHQSFINLMKD